ncbi:galectin-6 [Fundulus heteroclitus]|uniref:galectin-6 n=1 Tax=Fundulus heteroclitus TaxID=8078 RepID=UPI00165C2C13|nr:galectin-6 [Fundulus heteroclitus]
MAFVAPPGYQPVYNPRIPYLGPIYGGLRDGVSVYIQGSVPKDITRFLINLLCGESDSSDIALHFNPRFDGWDKVVFNSRQGGSWGSEEKIRSMPFSKGKAFELVIMITSKGFQTKVDGKEFFMFPHRIPVEQIRAIQVSGDVSVQTINIIGVSPQCLLHLNHQQLFNVYQKQNILMTFLTDIQGGCPDGMGGGMGQGGYPGGNMAGGCPDGLGGGMGGGYPGGPGGNMGGGYPGSHLPGMGGQPVYNPAVPYSGMIPGGMYPKRTIIIRGMVPYGANRMGFNLVVSRSRDIAFHMNPRVKERVVVRNNREGGKWGKEDRELSLSPFMEGQYFDMSIRCGNQRFKVFVNGQHLFDFFHRVSFSEIDKLEIEGDVQISYIHF